MLGYSAQEGYHLSSSGHMVRDDDALRASRRLSGSLVRAGKFEPLAGFQTREIEHIAETSFISKR